MQKILKFLVKFLNRYIKEEPVIELKESDEPASELLTAICSYALSQDIDKVHWDGEAKTFNSADRKEYNIWFIDYGKEWGFRKVSIDGSVATTKFENTPANRKLITDTIQALSNKGGIALLNEFKSKAV